MSAGSWGTESVAPPPHGRPLTVWRTPAAASLALPNSLAWPPRLPRPPRALLGAISARRPRRRRHGA
eukprot:9124253-Alexandrium_andersonii.AAC.1